jgi:hypothetical protein
LSVRGVQTATAKLSTCEFVLRVVSAETAAS